MVAKLYLDGCSMIYGQGLPREDSLGNLFHEIGGYDVVDKSRNGKSNISIALDTYRHADDFDVFVLGFTYSSRFGLEYGSDNLDFYSGFSGNIRFADSELEDEFLKLYKFFYLVFESPYCDNLSDMLVDYTIAFLKSKGKKVYALSWENRNTQADYDHPFFCAEDRLDDYHLNANATKKLFDRIQDKLGAE